MRRIRISAAALLLGSSIVVSVVAPASASCEPKLTKTCQALEQVVCDVFHKCL